MYAVDATAELIWDNWLWRRQPENRRHGDDDVIELDHLVIDHLRHVVPQARLIAMLRDPIKR